MPFLSASGVQTHVGQYGGNKCATAQLAFLHVRCADCHNAVAVQLLAGPVYNQAAVSIAVERYAEVRNCPSARALFSLPRWVEPQSALMLMPSGS